MVILNIFCTSIKDRCNYSQSQFASDKLKYKKIQKVLIDIFGIKYICWIVLYLLPCCYQIEIHNKSSGDLDQKTSDNLEYCL